MACCAQAVPNSRSPAPAEYSDSVQYSRSAGNAPRSLLPSSYFEHLPEESVLGIASAAFFFFLPRLTRAFFLL